jgi:hypothetical protein
LPALLAKFQNKAGNAMSRCLDPWSPVHWLNARFFFLRITFQTLKISSHVDFVQFVVQSDVLIGVEEDFDTAIVKRVTGLSEYWIGCK